MSRIHVEEKDSRVSVIGETDDGFAFTLFRFSAKYVHPDVDVVRLDDEEDFAGKHIRAMAGWREKVNGCRDLSFSLGRIRL